MHALLHVLIQVSDAETKNSIARLGCAVRSIQGLESGMSTSTRKMCSDWMGHGLRLGGFSPKIVQAVSHA